jgi:hypothetical protein
MSNMFPRVVGRIFIAIHTKTPPSDQEWDHSLRLINDDIANACTIVFTDGGAPNAAQRKRLSESPRGRSPVAVLSDSLIPRFVNASIALFNKSIRSYTSKDFEEACQYLNFTAEEKAQVLNVLREVQVSALPKKIGPLDATLAKYDHGSL